MEKLQQQPGVFVFVVNYAGFIFLIASFIFQEDAIKFIKTFSMDDDLIYTVVDERL